MTHTQHAVSQAQHLFSPSLSWSYHKNVHCMCVYVILHYAWRHVGAHHFRFVIKLQVLAQTVDCSALQHHNRTFCGDPSLLLSTCTLDNSKMEQIRLLLWLMSYCSNVHVLVLVVTHIVGRHDVCLSIKLTLRQKTSTSLSLSSSELLDEPGIGTPSPPQHSPPQIDSSICGSAY